MRTASGLTYEIMPGGDQAIVACTCWTEATPVIANLDTHWLRQTGAGAYAGTHESPRLGRECRAC